MGQNSSMEGGFFSEGACAPPKDYSIFANILYQNSPIIFNSRYANIRIDR